MLALITQRETVEGNSARDMLEQSYVEFYSAHGLHLIPMPNVPGLVEQYMDLPIERLILSGGDNLSGMGLTKNISAAREATEKALLHLAIKRGIPVLGVCRGMQMLNVFFKGSLVTNVLKNVKGSVPHVATTHDVTFVNDIVIKHFGKNHTVVNSYHDHGITVDVLSPHMQSFAISKDGLIEGIYHPNHPIAGVMWHPERNSPDPLINQKIIQAFMKRTLFWRK